MVQLLKMKELIYRFVGRFEIFVMAGIRFVIAFVAFSMINATTGYFEPLTEYPIALILALLCSFMPAGLMLFFGAAMILLQFYGLSLELCAITAMVFIILFCVFFRFSTRKGLYTVLTPLLSAAGVPYTMPVACGLLSEPYTVVSVIAGEVVYFLMKHVQASSAMFASDSNVTTKSILTMAVIEILLDKEMYLYLAAFAVAAIVVYCIRKLSMNQAHVIAVVLGIALQLVIVCAGEVSLGYSAKIGKVIIGCVISLIISLVINFMSRSLDYTRVEQLQFEDDEYYYYVKAVPKAFVTVQDKQVKQIHKKKNRPRKSPKGRDERRVPQSEDEE